jgi:hypothetical protein
MFAPLETGCKGTLAIGRLCPLTVPYVGRSVARPGPLLTRERIRTRQTEISVCAAWWVSIPFLGTPVPLQWSQVRFRWANNSSERTRKRGPVAGCGRVHQSLCAGVGVEAEGRVGFTRDAVRGCRRRLVPCASEEPLLVDRLIHLGDQGWPRLVGEAFAG